MAQSPVRISGITPESILGVPDGSTSASVDLAFRRLASAVHPDVLPGGQGLFLMLSAARDALKSGQPIPPADKPKAAPRGKPKAAPPAYWWETLKGNWACGTPQGVMTVFRSKRNWSRWCWVIPGERFSKESYETVEEAEAAAEAEYKEVFGL